MATFWLSRHKKAELASYCNTLGLDPAGSLKPELERMLTEHLRAHESELIGNPMFTPFYDTAVTVARSPEKLPNTVQAELPTTRSRRRTNRYVPGTTSFDSPEPMFSGHIFSEVKPEISSRQSTPGVVKRRRGVSRGVRSPREAAKVPLPPSPAAVADEIESRANAIVASATNAMKNTKIQQKAIGLRDQLSNAVAVNTITLTLEAVFLLVSVIPRTYEFTVPAIDPLKMNSSTYIIPNVFILFTGLFWKPFLAWLVAALVLPFSNAVLFNLVSNSVAAKDGISHKVDLLTFAVTRALMAYLVHYKDFSFWGMLGDDAFATIGDSIGREFQLIGAGICGIAALWEGILQS